MLELWRAQRTRRHVVGRIRPLVERTRARAGIADAAWSDPYVIGFLAMLITELAERHAGPMPDDALALVQAEAWADLTHEDSESIGERLHLLSAGGDALFEQGCRCAVRMADVLTGRAGEPSQPAAAGWLTAEGDAALIDLWAECFESRLPA